jgi:hypothetical protein
VYKYAAEITRNGTSQDSTRPTKLGDDEFSRMETIRYRQPISIPQRLKSRGNQGTQEAE